MLITRHYTFLKNFSAPPYGGETNNQIIKSLITPGTTDVGAHVLPLPLAAMAEGLVPRAAGIILRRRPIDRRLKPSQCT